MRGLLKLLLTLWLLVGVMAALQRGFLDVPRVTCDTAGTTALTVVAGPLNYVGANPRFDCARLQPSQGAS